MRLGIFEFHLWSVCVVFLLLRKWCMPDKCCFSCSFKFSKWRDWVPVLHRSGAEKAMKASSGSGVWGCSEPLGHCQGLAPLCAPPGPNWFGCCSWDDSSREMPVSFSRLVMIKTRPVGPVELPQSLVPWMKLVHWRWLRSTGLPNIHQDIKLSPVQQLCGLQLFQIPCHQLGIPL